MKNIVLLLITGIAILVSLGCDRRSIDIPTDPALANPKDADWVLAFEYVPNIKGYNYHISLYSTKPITEDMIASEIKLSLGDSLITMHYSSCVPFFTGWSSGIQYILDGYPVKLRINNNTVLNTSFKAVRKASAAFPAHYNYQQSLMLNWAVEGNNDYQFVKAESWHNNIDGCNTPYSSFARRIATDRRDFLFPANCVTLEGDSTNTNFVLCIEEVNYRIMGKTAIMVYQNETQVYPANGKTLFIAHKGRIWDIYKSISR